jgi:hypothetical protein
VIDGMESAIEIVLVEIADARRPPVLSFGAARRARHQPYRAVKGYQQGV